MNELFSDRRMVSAALAVACFGAAVFAVAAWLRPTTYRAEARLVVAPSAVLSEPDDAIYAEDVLSRRTVTATLAEILSAGRVGAAAVASLGSGELPDYELEAALVPETNVVLVFVEGPDAETTARLANALATRGVEFFEELYGLYEVEVIEDAEVPEEPNGLSVLALAAVGAVLGAVLGVVAVRAGRSRRAVAYASFDSSAG